MTPEQRQRVERLMVEYEEGTNLADLVGLGVSESAIKALATDGAHRAQIAASLRACLAALDDPDVARIRADMAERRRKRGAYWLTPEGRAECRETWADAPDECVPVLLAALEAAEQERDKAQSRAEMWVA